MLAILILVSQFDLLLSYRKCSIHSFSIVTKIKTKTEFFAVCNHNEPKREKVILYFNCMCVFLLLFQSFGRAHSLRTYKTAPKTHIDMRCEYAYSDKHDTRFARICIRGENGKEPKRLLSVCEQVSMLWMRLIYISILMWYAYRCVCVRFKCMAVCVFIAFTNVWTNYGNTSVYGVNSIYSSAYKIEWTVIGYV